uniref:hypothetical protein n=1 Tax=Alistipes sp. TaxID=1872444 RepID=UPI0040563BEE
MKKIFLLLAFVMTISVANAWSKRVDEAVMIVANEHLTTSAKKLVKKYLGKNFADDVQYLYAVEKEQAKTMDKKARRRAAEIHYLHLDTNFQPKSVKGKDAYKAIQEALAVLNNHKSHPKAEVTLALRTVINLVCDIHNLSKVRIDGIPHSQRDFKYKLPAGDYGKNLEVIKTAKWSKAWNGFDGGYGYFTANYWAEDIRIYLGKDFDKYAKGSLNEWVAESGKMAAHYLETYKPNAVVPYGFYKWREPVSYEQMIKATCRLAKLLNETIE